MASEKSGEIPSGGCWIPAWVLHSEELSLSQKVVFGRIEALATSKGYCWAKNESLADDLGMSSRQVRRHIGNLVSDGFLRRVLIRDQKGKVVERRLWPLNPEASSQEDVSDHTPPNQEDVSVLSGGSLPSSTPGRKRPVEERDSSKENREKRGGSDRTATTEQRDEQLQLPRWANLEAGFDPDCDDCRRVTSRTDQAMEACSDHYIPTHRRRKAS